MSDFRIFETDQFLDDLEQIARSGSPAIVEKLRAIVYPQLKLSPHAGPHIKKLKGWTPETRRYRIGSWRFFYEVDEEERIVFMIAAAHRGSAY